MYHQGLPGFCSAHWVIFVTALCCTKEKTDDEHLTDRERVGRLYEDTMYVKFRSGRLNHAVKTLPSPTHHGVGL